LRRVPLAFSARITSPPNAGLNLNLTKGAQVDLGVKLYLWEGAVEGTTATVSTGRHRRQIQSPSAPGLQAVSSAPTVGGTSRAIYRPEDHIGAVIASCDYFNTSFVVGTDSIFAVPKGCNTLLLAINDFAGHYGANDGELEIGKSRRRAKEGREPFVDSV
jgi:hypothetical protein